MMVYLGRDSQRKKNLTNVVATQYCHVKTWHVQETFPSPMPVVDVLFGLLRHIVLELHVIKVKKKTVCQALVIGSHLA